MKKGFCNRIISMIVTICMILTLCPVTVLAANEGDPSTITAGKLVAGAYGDLSQEEKELIGSGLLADVTYEYYVPGEGDELIEVDTENKTVAADPWTDAKGNVWAPVDADIIVSGSSVESVTPDGVDTYEYDGNAFSVEVTYEMYISVDADVQEQLLNTSGWLKDGIANLDTIAAQSSNMGMVEAAKDKLLYMCDDSNYPDGFRLSDDGKDAVNVLVGQMGENDGKLKLHAMVIDYLEGSKTEYLLNNGSEMRSELAELIGYVDTLANTVSAMNIYAPGLALGGLLTPEEAEMIDIMDERVSALKEGLHSAAGDDWTAAEKGTALVKADISANEYADLDVLVDALGAVNPIADITERILAAKAIVHHNLSVKDITVRVELKVVEDAVDSDDLVSGGVTKTFVLTLAENATKAEIEAALAELTVEEEAIAAWGDAYVAEHYVRHTTELPETLTEDIEYIITYSPATYTITYDYAEGTETKDVPYGYQTRLELYPDSGKVYDYTVNGEYQPQGSVYTVLGDVTITRQTGKPYTTTDLYTAIANMDGVSDKEKAILTAGALQGNTVVLAVRYPDTDAGSLVSIDSDLVLTAKTYASDYKGLVWAPYNYVVTAGDGTDEDPAAFTRNGDIYTAQITDSNYQMIKVYYRLSLVNFGADAAQTALDLVARLVEEAESQNRALASLSSPNVANNLDMLDATILDTLVGLIDRNKDKLHTDVAKRELLKECFTTVIGKIEADCLNAAGAPRIGVLIDAYVGSGKNLAYYYRNSEAFVSEVGLLTQHLDELLAADASLTADEKLAALAVLIDAVPDSMIPSDKVEEYTQKLPDLQSRMDEINANLAPVNSAVDTTSPNLNKLVNAMQMDGTVGTDLDGYVYLQSQSFNLAGSGKVILKINVTYGEDERSVSETVDQNAPVSQTAIDSLKEKVAALLTEMGIADDFWYDSKEYADGDALNNLLGKKYASNHTLSFTWVMLEHTYCEINGHTEQAIPGEPPTCTGTGLTSGLKCSVCQEILVPQQEIPAAGHAEQIIPGKAPTCTGTGLTDGVKCFICNEILVEQETIDAQGHDFTGEWLKDETGHWHVCLRDCGAIDAVVAHSYDTNNCAVEAHCTICSYTKEAGQHAWGPLERVDDEQHKQVCSSCQTEKITSHVWTLVDEKDVTCEEDGYKKYTCSCHAEKTDDQTKLGHDWSAWTKVDNEKHTRVCGNDAGHVETATHTWDDGALNADGDMVYTCTAQCGAAKLVVQNKEEKLEFGAPINANLTPAQDGSVVLAKPEADGFTGDGYRYDYVINGVTYKVTNDSQSERIYPGNVADATVKLVNIDNEKLELLLKAMGDSAQAEKNAALKPTNDGYYTGIKVEGDSKQIMSDVMALVRQEELGTGKYGYVALDSEPLLKNNKVSLLGLLRMVMGADGKYTSQEIIDLSNGTNQTLVSGKLALKETAPATGLFALLRAFAANDGHEIDFRILLTDTPDEAGKVGAALTKVKDYITFDIKSVEENGAVVSNRLDIDVKADLPSKVYEIYVAALRLAGKVDVNDANAVKAAVAYAFLKDYVDVLLGADVTTTTLMNTAAKLGVTVDLSEYEGLFNAVKGKLDYGQNITYSADGLSAFVTLTNKNMETAIDRMEPMIGDAELLDVLKSMMVECQDGETVDVKLNAFVTNFTDGDDDGFVDTNYEAIIVDVGAVKKPGLTQKADVFDFTADLAASVAGFESAAAIMLQKDVAADLHFKHTTILDLNGHTIHGTVTADAKLIIIDSTLATTTVGGVTGTVTGSDITILAGTYGADVSSYLKSGYIQQSGTVKNEYYEIKKVGNDITFEVNADILAARELPSVWLAADMAGDLAMNYFTTASLAFADLNNNPYSIFAVNLDDLVGLLTGTVDMEKVDAIKTILKRSDVDNIEGVANELVALLKDAINKEKIDAIAEMLRRSGAGGIEGLVDELVALLDDTVNKESVDAIKEILERAGVVDADALVDELVALFKTAVNEEQINAVLGILKLSGANGVEGFVNDLLVKSMDFDALAASLNGSGELIKYNTVLAPWSVKLDAVDGEDYLTVGIVPGEEVSGSVTVTVVGAQESREELAALLTEMGKIMDPAKNSVTVTLRDPVFNDRTLTVAGGGNAAIDIDMSENPDYAAIVAVALADAGVNRDVFVAALNAYFADNDDTDALFEALAEVTVAQFISAVKNPDLVNGISAMMADLGVVSNSAAELGDTFQLAVKAVSAVGRVLTRVEFDGNDRVVFGPTGKFSYTNSDVVRNVTRTAAGITVSGTVTAESISVNVRLFCGHNYVSVVTPPTCEDPGYTTHTCSECGHSYVDTYTDPTGHDWNDPEYTFAADGSSCTAKRVCANDNTHVETATATIISTVKTPAGCESVGTTTYTATFTESWAVTQTKDVDDIPATDHSWGAWNDLGNGQHQRVCANDPAHVQTVPHADANGDNLCDDCNATICVHSWGPWTKVDSQTHKRVCANDPAHVEIADHADANNDRRCDDCGASLRSGGSGGGSGVASYKIEVAETENGTVTLNTTQATRNTKVTITATPAEGYEVVKVIVTQNSNGAECDVTAVSGTEYTFLMPGDSVTVTVIFECTGSDEFCPSRHLTDVDQSRWYHLAVDYVVVNGLMCGIGDNLFAPDAAIDRAMVVQVLYNQEGTPAVAHTNEFSDVADGKWYTDAIEWGVANDVIAGYGDGTFKPEQNITREELATIFYNYANFKGIDTSAQGDLSKFSDGATVSDWATKFMRWAVGSGLMSGDGSKLNPTQKATRAEAAQMVKNFNESFDD